MAQVHRALLEQIEQSTRCSDEDIDTAFQFLALFAITHAAVYESRAQISKASIIAKGGLDLRGKFACRFDHQTSKRAMLREQRQNRKSKCRSLSGTSLGGAD